MAEKDRARHAFGSSQNIEAAVQAGKIDAFDILFLDGDTDPKVGWLDKNGNPVIMESATELKGQVSELETQISNKANAEQVAELKTELATKVSAEEVDAKINTTVTDKVNTIVTEKVDAAVTEEVKEVMAEKVDTVINEKVDTVVNEKVETLVTEKVTEQVTEKVETTVVKAMAKTNKYEILNVPKGTLVDYNDKEIRVMVPADTVWEKQTVGATGNANMYYMAFRAYAPEGAVGFKEGDKGVIVDEYFDFNGDFAGTDEFGRNYSVCWLALAMYDEASDTWTYFGKNSNVQKYIGWDYIVEWYDADGVVIESDCVRIGLANEDCYFVNVPYYIGAMEKKIDEKIAEEITKIETKIEESESSYEIIEF